MKTIDGVTIIKKEGYSICHITNFSDEIKKLIRKQLSYICHGRADAVSKRKMYNYTNTLKEFIKRYNEKANDTQKGMIGELIVHLLLNEFFTEFETISPFFNIEERSIKKGFDVVLTSKEDKSMWITEVKSGELHKDKNSNGTMVDLLNTAKTDLYSRLNGENHSLWLNAIHGAKIAIESHNDLKDAIIDILEEYGDDSTEGKIDSTNMNVILVGALFSTLDDAITESIVCKKYKSIEKEKKFKCCIIFSIQKESYNKIYQFLKSEALS